MEEPVIVNGKVYSSAAHYTATTMELIQKEELEKLKHLDAEFNELSSLIETSNRIIKEDQSIVDRIDKSVSSVTDNIDKGTESVKSSSSSSLSKITKFIKLLR